MTDHPTAEAARPSQYEYDALWARLIEHAPSPLVTKYRDAVEMRLLERLNNESACFDHAHAAAAPAQEPLDEIEEEVRLFELGQSGSTPIQADTPTAPTTPAQAATSLPRPSSGCRHQWTHIGGYPDEPEGLAYDMCSKCGKVKGLR